MMKNGSNKKVHIPFLPAWHKLRTFDISTDKDIIRVENAMCEALIQTIVNFSRIWETLSWFLIHYVLLCGAWWSGYWIVFVPGLWREKKIVNCTISFLLCYMSTVWDSRQKTLFWLRVGKKNISYLRGSQIFHTY